MENVILALVILALLAGAGGYVYKAKKSGKHCIGCPDGGGCCHCKGQKSCPGCGDSPSDS